MSVELLDKTRKINYLLQSKSTKERVIFNDICKILSESLNSNILVISRKGKLLGLYNDPKGMYIGELLTLNVGTYIDDRLNIRLNGILSTKENFSLETLGFSSKVGKIFNAIVTPISISGERLGHLFIYKSEGLYNIEDIILAEYGSTVIGLETMRSEKEELAAEKSKHQKLESALNSLSNTEKIALKAVFKQIPNGEGIIVASRIADECAITRSIIVNAIRKMESAEVLESKSSGMKGTFIRLKNEFLLECLEEL